MESYKTNSITRFFGLASFIKERVYRQKNEQLKLDLVALAKEGGNIGKDLFFYLRPLGLSGTIQFKNLFDNNPNGLISFEEALSRALDKPGRRYAFCVGDGDERWGVAQVVFENKFWIERIVPLFKNASAIISMPGATDGCLNESYLIRTTIELCKRTIFVIPPLICYRPEKLKKEFDIGAYYNQVVRRHAQEVGLYFPDARMDAGVFLVMDPQTGRPVKQLEWQQLRVEKSNVYYGTVLSQRVETTPVLTAARIAAAVAMVA
jgi:hypothetical protein